MRYAAYLIGDITGGAPVMKPPFSWAGPLVVGTTDASWRIERISSDVEELFGVDAMECLKTTLLDIIHPDDVGTLLHALQTTTIGTTMCPVRVRHCDGHWVPVQCLFVTENATGPPIAFALMPELKPTAGAATDRAAELERRLRRIAAELRAAGLLDDVGSLPTTEEFPQIASLTSRQWQILVRLLRGERVPTIARELYLSPGTVRNHLAAMFDRFGVHSQAELIARLRRR